MIHLKKTSIHLLHGGYEFTSQPLPRSVNSLHVVSLVAPATTTIISKKIYY